MNAWQRPSDVFEKITILRHLDAPIIQTPILKGKEDCMLSTSNALRVINYTFKKQLFDAPFVIRQAVLSGNHRTGWLVKVHALGARLFATTMW
jgi:hypothetical protein